MLSGLITDAANSHQARLYDVYLDVIIKEVKEEAGLDVIVKRVIAVQDREKHNLPIYAYKVCKIFMQCEVIGGQLNNREQIEMCFKAMQSDTWEALFD